MCRYSAPWIGFAMLISVVLVFIVSSNVALATEDVSETASSTPSASPTQVATPTFGSSTNSIATIGSGPKDILNATQLVKVVIALVITVVAILALSAFAKKAKWARAADGQHLRVIDSLAVGARDRIMLVAVDDQRIVLAATPGQMRALHTFHVDKADSFDHALKESLDLVKGGSGA